MKELKKYQCELCNTVYNDKKEAMSCEAEHIPFSKLQIVRGIHKSVPPCSPEEGLWPDVIIVGMDNVRDVLVRYKLVGPEEFKIGPLMTDPYYYFHEN